jgi:hypothetical protein
MLLGSRLSTFDFESHEVGTGFLDRSAQSQFHGDRGRRTSLAGALEPKSRAVVFKTKQFHVSAVALHVRPDLFHRSFQPGGEIHRVQTMNQQQATNDRVLDELAIDVLAGGAAALDHFHCLRQSVPVKTYERMKALVHQGAGDRISQLLGLFDQSLKLATLLQVIAGLGTRFGSAGLRGAGKPVSFNR